MCIRDRHTHQATLSNVYMYLCNNLIQSPFVSNLFNGIGADNTAIQMSILIAGIVIFLAFTLIGYRMAVKRFLKVEIL